MKRVYLLIIAALTIVGATSCGSNKPAAVAEPTPAPAPAPTASTEITEGTDVILYAEAEPDRRAYGVGTHFQEPTARRTAEVNARAALATAIQTMVIQSFDSYANSMAIAGSQNGVMGVLAEDQAAALNDAVAAVSKESVTNTAAVKMQRYSLNGQFKIYVCVEHRLAMKELIKQISDKINASIPDDIKNSIQYNQFLHEQKMEEAFKEYSSVSL